MSKLLINVIPLFLPYIWSQKLALLPLGSPTYKCTNYESSYKFIHEAVFVMLEDRGESFFN